MNNTHIQWCDYSANVIKYRDEDGKSVWACVKVSAGCTNCYAEALAKRYGRGGPFTVGATAKVTPYFDEAEAKALLSPKRLPAGSKVFIGDMTDVFGPWVPDEMLDRLFAVFALRPDVVFQVLTKRPERMRAYVSDACTRGRVARAMDAIRVPVVEGEEERPIPGYPGYWITNAGRVLSAKRGGERSVMRPDIGEQGHCRVTLHGGPAGRTRFLIHRLVLEVWEGPPPTEDAQACHLNGNPMDNRISNLRWGSQSDNWSDRARHGNFRSYSKLSPDDVASIRRRGAAGESAYAIAKDYPVSDTQVRNILNGAQWVTEPGVQWPLANCWLGTSVEDQLRANERIPELLATPAAVRFLSCEPLLGPVDLQRVQPDWLPKEEHPHDPILRLDALQGLITGMDEYVDWDGGGGRRSIDWVIVGGESGPGARACDIGWLKSIAAQCRAAGVACFFKQVSGPRPGMPAGDPDLDELKEFPR